MNGQETAVQRMERERVNRETAKLHAKTAKTYLGRAWVADEQGNAADAASLYYAAARSYEMAFSILATEVLGETI